MGHICPTLKESFQVRWDNGIPLFLHSAICLEVSLFRWTSQCIFPRNSRVQMILCAMLHGIAHSIICRLLLKCDGTRAETRFCISAKRTSPFKSARGEGFSSVDCWQASCAHQPAGFVLLVRACVLQSCDAYWLPTQLSCFPFTSPSMRHRMPSHFKRSLHGCFAGKCILTGSKE